ncbi:hypothetical protein ABIE40_001708 [Rhizobium sp. OAE497]
MRHSATNPLLVTMGDYGFQFLYAAKEMDGAVSKKA